MHRTKREEMIGSVFFLVAAAAYTHAAPVAADPALQLSTIEQNAAEEFLKADRDHNEQLQRKEFVDWWVNRAKVPEDGADIIDFHKSKDPGGSDIPADFRASVKDTEKVTLSFWTAFVNSIAMILVTEIGDKTFFIAAILAMRHDRSVIFLGAISALAVMTVLSAAMGFMLPTLLPRQYTHWAATFLFVYFGVRLLVDARNLEGGKVSEELEEVEESLKDKREDDPECASEELVAKKSQRAVFLQALTLTFVAEWGDRSQIATIALAAAKDPIGVTVGGILGHSMCTGLAVVGGRILASKISEKTVLMVGGILFLVFAVHAVYAGPDP